MAKIEVEREKPDGTPDTDRDTFLEDLARDAGALVDAHPIGTLATALGVGYALGGGLFTSLTSRLLRWGLRLGVQFAVLPALERELTGLAGELGKTLKGEDAAREPPPAAHH